jgi:predicted lipoprotein DUF2380
MTWTRCSFRETKAHHAQGLSQAGLLLVLALLSTGCVSLTPPPGQGMNLRYTPREAAGPALAQGPSVSPEFEAPEGLPRRRASRESLTVAGGDRESEAARRNALAAHLAFLGAVGDVSVSTRRIASELSRLRSSKRGIAGPVSDLFLPFVDYGVQQLRWIDAELAAATRLAHTAAQLDDPDLQLALLRLAGPRLQSALLGSLLHAAWVDFLNLADVILCGFPYYGVERLYRQMDRWRTMLEPAMTALASLEPGRVEAAAKDLPALMGHLTSEFTATQEAVRVAAENFQKMVVLKESLEALTMLSAMKFSLPALPPSAPALLGVGLVAGGDGVMMGTRIVVSAEWVEMMRQLVRAGVLSLPVISAAVRIQAGQVLMAQSHGELPRGVREALGDGPEVRAMRVTGKAGAGMSEPPQHHVLPQEFREWFEQRGFTGEMDIDQFCVEMEQAHHEAIHGGGDWKLGRIWPGEWNRMIMKALQRAETEAGRMLTRNEILNLVAEAMEEYNLPMNFTPWRGS